MTAAVEARETLLRLRPEFSVAWMTENQPFSGEMEIVLVALLPWVTVTLLGEADRV